MVTAGGAVVPCLFTELAFFACVGGSAVGGFFGTLYGNFWMWAWQCAFYQ